MHIHPFIPTFIPLHFLLPFTAIWLLFTLIFLKQLTLQSRYIIQCPKGPYLTRVNLDSISILTPPSPNTLTCHHLPITHILFPQLLHLPFSSLLPFSCLSSLRSQTLDGNYIDLAQLIQPSLINISQPREMQTILGPMQLCHSIHFPTKKSHSDRICLLN